MAHRLFINNKGIIVQAFLMDPRTLLPDWIKREWIGRNTDGKPCLLIPTKAQRIMCVVLGRVIARRVQDGHLRHLSEQAFYEQFHEYIP